jgi:hypothetical protein
MGFIGLLIIVGDRSGIRDRVHSRFNIYYIHKTCQNAEDHPVVEFAVHELPHSPCNVLDPVVPLLLLFIQRLLA